MHVQYTIYTRCTVLHTRDTHRMCTVQWDIQVPDGVRIYPFSLFQIATEFLSKVFRHCNWLQFLAPPSSGACFFLPELEKIRGILLSNVLVQSWCSPGFASSCSSSRTQSVWCSVCCEQLKRTDGVYLYILPTIHLFRCIWITEEIQILYTTSTVWIFIWTENV